MEEHQRCFRLGSYFMAAVLEAASYSKGGFSLCLAVSVRPVMVPGGSMSHLEPGTISASIMFVVSGSCPRDLESIILSHMKYRWHIHMIFCSISSINDRIFSLLEMLY